RRTEPRDQIGMSGHRPSGSGVQGAPGAAISYVPGPSSAARPRGSHTNRPGSPASEMARPDSPTETPYGRSAELHSARRTSQRDTPERGKTNRRPRHRRATQKPP